jgi:cell division transport system ATP-binding protein
MIRIDNVTKHYNGAARAALENVTLEIEKGDFVFLVGASGSGKSSLMRLMLREDMPNSGSVYVLGENLKRLPNRRVPYFRRKVGMVFQDFRLLPNKTVAQNVAFSLEVIGKSQGFIQAAVPDVLELVGLAHKAGNLPGELSGGEQQRVALARAIVNKPAILLADEPTGNLDPSTSEDIMRLIERINAAGTTVVMATHDRAIVDRLQKRVVVLSHGQIISDERETGYSFTPANQNTNEDDN